MRELREKLSILCTSHPDSFICSTVYIHTSILLLPIVTVF